MEKRTLLLLQGLLCDERVWRDQVAALSGEFECRVADYGTSDSIASMAERVLAEARAQRFGVIGHSMGGRVALQMLRMAPERVENLVLMDTGADARAEGVAGQQEADKRMALVRLAEAEGMRCMGRAWTRGMVHPSRLQTPLFDEILDMIERKTLDTYRAQVRALLNRPAARPVLQAARCPVLLLCGRQDEWSPLQRHEDMQRLLPAASLEVIEESGHMTTMEQPGAVNAALQRWLAA